MSERAPSRMTSDEFIAWAMARPEGGKYELYRGEIRQMAPERALHSRVKNRFIQRMLNAIDAGCLPCEVFSDSMSVEIDAATTYEPDVVLRCGAPTPPDSVKISDPLVIVEVLSPSTRTTDVTEKLEAYFRLQSMKHYLVVNAQQRMVMHHERTSSGKVVTHFPAAGPIRLDPPGIEIADFFPPE